MPNLTSTSSRRHLTMPNFTSYPASPSTKLLYLGHCGAGKTGSLCSLAAAGYRVRILDLDRGCEIISDYVTNPKSPYLRERPNLWSAHLATTVADRISYVTVTEGYNILGTKAVPKGTAWHQYNQQLNNWIDGDDRPGNISRWGPSDVLVIDGLSRLCEAAMNYQLSLNNRLQQGPLVGTSGGNDYTGAYKLITDHLDLLKCDEIKCNIIMICHISFLEEPGPQMVARRDKKGFPQTIGPKIAPMIGQYFNHSLRAKSTGNAPNIRRVIVTNNDENIELKNTAPLRVSREYSLETGLAEYFRDIRAPALPAINTGIK